jgi:hypothetical protein
MVVDPAQSALATPAALIPATVVELEVQAACVVTFCVLPLLYVPVAVNCSVEPPAIEGVFGVTAIDVSVPAEEEVLVPGRISIAAPSKFVPPFGCPFSFAIW